LGPARSKTTHRESSTVGEPELSTAVKREMLKLMMREREQIAQRTVKLDYWIWVLEEFFRAEGS
jgi:hypothetical protein